MARKLTLLKNSRLYYMRDTRQVVGNCILWWGKNNSGYTCDLDRAEVYPEDVAMSMHRSRASDVPYPKDLMDSIAYRHVDHQVVDRLEMQQREAAQENKEGLANVV
jgi:hypothetical protein